MVSRDPLVVGEGLHPPLRGLGHVAQADKERSGTRTVHGGLLIVSAGRAFLRCDRHPFHGEARSGQSAEVFGHAGAYLIENLLVAREHLPASLVIIRIEKAWILAERRHALTHGAGGEPLGP